ncbi:MAG: DUF4350 domain-containing protein [Myxococcota bacterium]
MTPRTLLPLVLVVWTVLGVALLVFVPQDRAVDPSQSATLYGEQRTSFSSADGGVLAFFRLLRALGFDVRRNAGFRLPESGVHLILAPEVRLDDDEADRLVEWIRRGGHLVYAPTRLVGSYTENGIEREFEVPDPLLTSLSAIEFQDELNVRAGVLGAGRVVILQDGAWRLSNRVVFERGLEDELAWLAYITEGQERLTFDEARAGAMLSGGLLTAVFGERFAWPFALLAMTGVLALWSTLARRVPVVSVGKVRGAEAAEHITAVARALRRERRVSLVRHLAGEFAEEEEA